MTEEKSPNFYLYMVQEGSQKKIELKKKLLLYLTCKQIWLNLPMDG
jgi:hypothetical protein